MILYNKRSSHSERFRARWPPSSKYRTVQSVRVKNPQIPVCFWPMKRLKFQAFVLESDFISPTQPGPSKTSFFCLVLAMEVTNPLYKLHSYDSEDSDSDSDLRLWRIWLLQAKTRTRTQIWAIAQSLSTTAKISRTKVNHFKFSSLLERAPSVFECLKI